MGFLDGVSAEELDKAEEYRGFQEFPAGENEGWIDNVREKTSASGNPMLEITFANSAGAEIRWYIVEGEFKLRNLKSLYTAFKIPLGEKDTRKWIGKRGIVVVKEGDEYNGRRYNKVSYVKSAKDTGAEARPPARPAETPPPSKPAVLPPAKPRQPEEAIW